MNFDIRQEHEIFDKNCVGWIKKKWEEGKWPRWLTPNFITLSRLMPVGVALYVMSFGKSYFYITAVLIAISGLLDLADGIVARGTDNITELGKFLDQFIDKITVLAALWIFIFMTFFVEEPNWDHPTFIAMVLLWPTAAVITFFDLLLLIRRLAVKLNPIFQRLAKRLGFNFGSKEIGANNHGKYKANLQFWGVCIVICSYGVGWSAFLVFGLILLMLSTFFAYQSFKRQSKKN